MTIVEELEIVVVKHMRQSKTATLSGGSHARSYSQQILAADLHETAQFNVSKDSENLEELARSLNSVVRGFEALSYDGKFNYDSYLKIFNSNNGESEHLGAYTEFLLQFKAAVIALKVMRREKRFRTKATAKRNWRGASVASAYRSIWAQ